MTRADFIAQNPIVEILESKGVKVIGGGEQRTAKCPFHEDKNPSLSINVPNNIWKCMAGCGGGGVIDLLARYSGISAIDYIKRSGINGDSQPATVAPIKPTIEKIYNYRDERGDVVYQAVRLRPKSFRQRRPDGNGKWIWNMEGVRRVLYRLPELMKAEEVWICEGEKDADTLVSLGYCASCNVGGAGKWLDAYTEMLVGKEVVICGDNDDAGKKHVDAIFESIAGKVKTARIVVVPKTHKDVTEFAESLPTQAEAKRILDELKADTTAFVNGVRLPVYTMAEIEPLYKRQVRSSEKESLNLGKWLPTLGRDVRSLIPGELVLIIGDTGTGKTAVLQSIAFHAAPLPTLLMELELPPELLFERFVAMKTKMLCSEVERAYRDTDDSLGKEALEKSFAHLMICTESRITLESLESIIVRSELKMGCRPKLVVLDYIQLMQGEGKRYERTSDAAEGLKVIAKQTKTIIVVASQVHRSEDDDPEVTLHSGKDSGALENSAGLVLGAWRDVKEKELLHIKVLKNTKGTAGRIVPCNFDGAKMQITERSPYGLP